MISKIKHIDIYLNIAIGYICMYATFVINIRIYMWENIAYYSSALGCANKKVIISILNCFA